LCAARGYPRGAIAPRNAWTPDGVDALVPIGFDHGVDAVLEGRGIGQDTRDVVEQDAFLGKIRHFSDG
jgi:hypothetical protein